MALSPLTGKPVQSLDVTSAYLQAKLRTEEEYYVVLPQEVVALMSDEELKVHYSVEKPVYRLRKALYGLQRSAFDWITTMIEHLESKGWTSSAFDPALLMREVDGQREMLCLYVDDVLLLAPPHRMEACWDEVLQQFQASEPAECTEYIGVRFPRTTLESTQCMVVDVRDYATSIVRDMEKERYQSVALARSDHAGCSKETALPAREDQGRTCRPGDAPESTRVHRQIDVARAHRKARHQPQCYSTRECCWDLGRVRREGDAEVGGIPQTDGRTHVVLSRPASQVA